MHGGVDGWGVSWRRKCFEHGPECIQSPEIATSFSTESREVRVSFSNGVVARSVDFGGNPIDDPSKGTIWGSYCPI